MRFKRGPFDGNAGAGSAGATPAAEGATPPQSEPVTPPAAAPAPAAVEPAAKVDDSAELGEAGKRAIKAERDRAKAAESERDALKTRVDELENATRSDQEKAVADARKDAETVERTKWTDTIRNLRVEGALRDAGCTDPAIASKGSEFGRLKVADSGDVEGLTEAIEAFKAAHPTLFPSGRPQGDFGGGARSGSPAKPATLQEAITQQLTQPR